MSTVSTIAFLGYLHDHATTAELAEALSEVLVMRGRLAAAPFAMSRGVERVAS